MVFLGTLTLMVVTRWSQGGHKVVTRWSQGGRKVVARWSQGGRKVAARWSQGGRKVVVRWSQGGRESALAPPGRFNAWSCVHMGVAQRAYYWRLRSCRSPSGRGGAGRATTSTRAAPPGRVPQKRVTASFLARLWPMANPESGPSLGSIPAPAPKWTPQKRVTASFLAERWSDCGPTPARNH